MDETAENRKPSDRPDGIGRSKGGGIVHTKPMWVGKETTIVKYGDKKNLIAMEKRIKCRNMIHNSPSPPNFWNPEMSIGDPNSPREKTRAETVPLSKRKTK